MQIQYNTSTMTLTGTMGCVMKANLSWSQAKFCQLIAKFICNSTST